MKCRDIQISCLTLDTFSHVLLALPYILPQRRGTSVIPVSIAINSSVLVNYHGTYPALTVSTSSHEPMTPNLLAHSGNAPDESVEPCFSTQLHVLQDSL